MRAAPAVAMIQPDEEGEDLKALIRIFQRVLKRNMERHARR